MSAFSVDFVSPENYEHLAAEISFKGQLLCQINRERSDAQLEVEFFHEHRILKEQVTMKFSASDFQDIFNKVCEELRSL